MKIGNELPSNMTDQCVVIPKLDVADADLQTPSYDEPLVNCNNVKDVLTGLLAIGMPAHEAVASQRESYPVSDLVVAVCELVKDKREGILAIGEIFEVVPEESLAEFGRMCVAGGYHPASIAVNRMREEFTVKGGPVYDMTTIRGDLVPESAAIVDSAKSLIEAFDEDRWLSSYLFSEGFRFDINKMFGYPDLNSIKLPANLVITGDIKIERPITGVPGIPVETRNVDCMSLIADFIAITSASVVVHGASGVNSISIAASDVTLGAMGSFDDAARITVNNGITSVCLDNIKNAVSVLLTDANNVSLKSLSNVDSTFSINVSSFVDVPNVISTGKTMIHRSRCVDFSSMERTGSLTIVGSDRVDMSKLSKIDKDIRIVVNNDYKTPSDINLSLLGRSEIGGKVEILGVRENIKFKDGSEFDGSK